MILCPNESDCAWKSKNISEEWQRLRQLNLCNPNEIDEHCLVVQTAATGGIARSLSTKASLKRPSTTPAQPNGKENGVAMIGAGKEYGQEFPSVPTHGIRRTESRGYDRYGEQVPAY